MNNITLPEVTIILSIYKPNEDWLRKQLLSINGQEYPKLKLLVWNDCPEDDSHEHLFKECLKKVPFDIYKGERNLGATPAYEKLTSMVETDYLAFCDQDDIWLPDKLHIMMQEFLADNELTLVCGDVQVIDQFDNKIADSITEIYRRQVPCKDENILEVLMVRNFVIACTILMKTGNAKRAIPFFTDIFPDYWLAIHEAVYGKIKYLNRPLIQYRLHGTNQSRPLAGIMTKDDYYEKRIVRYYDRLIMLQQRLARTSASSYIDEKFVWASARKKYYEKRSIGNFLKLLFLLQNNMSITCFELLLPWLPDIIFQKIIKDIKSNKI